MSYCNGEAHFIAGSVAVGDITAFGLEGWLLQTDAPVDFSTMETLWDSQVPKDDDTETIDESHAIDTDPFFEPSKVSLTQIFDMELLQPERVFQLQKWISLATMPIGLEPGSPTTWIPSHFQKIEVTKNYRSGPDSGLLFGVASPDFVSLKAGVSDNLLNVITDSKGMYVMAHLEQFIENAMISMIDLVETGAETPFDDLLTFINKNLETAMIDDATDGFQTVTWQAFLKMTVAVNTVGEVAMSTIGPDQEAN